MSYKGTYYDRCTYYEVIKVYILEVIEVHIL